MKNNSICKRILSERKKLGLTQDEMGEALGISVNAYRDIEKGKTLLISKRVEELSRILKITYEELLMGYPLPSDDYKQKLEDTEKEFKRKVSDLENNFKLTVTEKEGEISILKTSLLNKDKIIGLLKEHKADY